MRHSLRSVALASLLALGGLLGVGASAAQAQVFGGYYSPNSYGAYPGGYGYGSAYGTYPQPVVATGAFGGYRGYGGYGLRQGYATGWGGYGYRHHHHRHHHGCGCRY